MKKLLMAVALFGAIGVCTAQRSLGIEKNKVVKEEEVPVTVIIAFQKEVPNPPKGNWTVHFVETLNGTKTQLWPINYSYKEAGKKGKTIARFTPDGKLEYARDTEQSPAKSGGD